MCILRVSGRHFNPTQALATTSLCADRVYHAGDPVHPWNPEGRVHAVSGFSVLVIGTAPTRLVNQVTAALAFLELRRADIRSLHANGVDLDIRLDFPVPLEAGVQVAAQFELFPAALVQQAGALGIGLEISIYPCSELDS